MKRCSLAAAAACPYRQYCEPNAVFCDGSECDKFNEKIDPKFERGLAALADYLHEHPEILPMGGASDA